ncbi:hypothetical protein FRB99_005438 [Tulasnella sp. 403]|nr:hypothetical protein FRB99_005438 [Tulasnella sp. 403]
MTPSAATPTHDDLEELLLSCRYGELDEVREFVDTFGKEHLSSVRDENGNTVLHMTCGNGHTALLEYLLPLVPPELLSVANNSRSTPLHWATTNKHMDVIQRLVRFPGGPGALLIDQKNQAGLTAVGEAELVEWNEGARWLVSQMDLDSGESADVKEEDAPAEDETELEMKVDPERTRDGQASNFGRE